MKMYAMTDVGCKRSSNQDAFCCSAARNQAEFLVLCDGMGGHRGGNLAAEIAVRAFHEELSYRVTPDLHLKDLKSILAGIIARVSALIADAAKHSEFSGMGSTVVLAVRSGKRLCIAHVGDSRAYLFRDGTLRRLTKDHSLVQGLIDQGEISPEEGENHPHRNVITRSLGYADDSEPEILMSDLRAGDVYLLCTDGLTVSVKDDRLQEILRTTAPEDLAGVLVARALENGCPDNVTVGILAEEAKEAKKQ